jgi:hypothetical protein
MPAAGTNFERNKQSLGVIYELYERRAWGFQKNKSFECTWQNMKTHHPSSDFERRQDSGHGPNISSGGGVAGPMQTLTSAIFHHAVQERRFSGFSLVQALPAPPKL